MRRTRGMTLIEILIATSLVVGVFTAMMVYMMRMSRTGTNALRTNGLRNLLDGEIRTVVDTFKVRYTYQGPPPGFPVSVQTFYPVLGQPAFANVAQPACATEANAPCKAINLRAFNRAAFPATVRRLVRYETLCSTDAPSQVAFNLATVKTTFGLGEPLPLGFTCPAGQVPIVQVSTWPDETIAGTFTTRLIPNRQDSEALSAYFCFRQLDNCAAGTGGASFVLEAWMLDRTGQLIVRDKRVMNTDDRSLSVELLPR